MEGSYVIRTFLCGFVQKFSNTFFALSAQFSTVEVNQFSTSNSFSYFQLCFQIVLERHAVVISALNIRIKCLIKFVAQYGLDWNPLVRQWGVSTNAFLKLISN
jgi:hypothetical protein